MNPRAESRREGKEAKRPKRELRQIRTDVAGIDLSAREHWVCGPEREDGAPNVERFGTTTAELVRLADWLMDQGVKSVAIESTGVYWIPLYDLLEGRGIEVVLVNARHLKGVPGRKSDMIDCQWIQLLHSCGLLKGSFRPAEAIVRLRALRREQANLVEGRTRIVQRMQKSLDQMNVKIHHAVTDLVGVTGLAILRAIIAGERDPARLAALRDKGCKKSAEEIAEHLEGTWREEHLFILKLNVRRYEEINRDITEYQAQERRWLEELQGPERRDQQPPAHPNPSKEKAIRRRGDHDLRTALWRVSGLDLTRIDGISPPAGAAIISEIGLDLSSFPTEKHFVSWLRLSPRISISGGKPLPKKRRNAAGATRVSAVLRMAALTLMKSQSALGAYARSVARRKNGAVAVFATARKIALLIYRMLRFGQDYLDQGATAYETQYRNRRVHSLTEAARQLGYRLVPAAGPIPATA
jgi:transposase